jgi:hypothetical protein
MTEPQEPLPGAVEDSTATRRAWFRVHALPKLAKGLRAPDIAAELIGELPRKFEDSYILPGMARDIDALAKASGFRLNVKDTLPSGAKPKQLALFTWDEIVALIAHMDHLIDQDEQSKRRTADEWIRTHPEHTTDEVLAAAKEIRAGDEAPAGDEASA